ncbi:spore coat U domain-containing protein [Halomonas sp. HNIBRBA4712]|uniref:Csu type fimbrial protein n=1 Tax=Halomonas sp. HNIBRBA4712 TaxID=3373087 RepID=UPI00374726F0
MHRPTAWGHALAGWIGLMVSASSSAQTLPGTTFQVGATVTRGCLINSQLPSQIPQLGNVGRLDFGIDSALSRATRDTTLVRSGGITLSCSPGIALTMQVGAGLHAQGGNRRMQHQQQDAFVTYRLYQDAGFQTLIGIDQAFALDTDSGALNVQFPVRGRLTLPGQLPAGEYTDELTFTLTW